VGNGLVSYLMKLLIMVVIFILVSKSTLEEELLLSPEPCGSRGRFKASTLKDSVPLRENH
jgi:hypothetical protein